MNRRSFLQTLVGGVATVAVVRTFPFRVYSFPREIVKPNLGNLNRALDAWNAKRLMAESLNGKVRVFAVDFEVVIVNSWTPKTGKLVATRGKNGLYEVPLPDAPDCKVLSSWAKVID